MQHKNAKVVQGSRLGGMGLTEILMFQGGQISEITTSISLPARNLRKEINIKIIQRNYDGKIRKGYET